jgi:outer membrane immunogenic protein
MFKARIAAMAVVATVTAGSALAADLPSRKGPPPAYLPPPPLMTWTGFYVGLNAGGVWSANGSNPNNLAPYTNTVAGGVVFLPGSTGGSNAGGFVGGGQIGYNYQLNSIVVGAEADFQGTTMSGSAAPWAVYPAAAPAGSLWWPLAPAGANVALNWFGTVRGRAGFLFTPTLLVYGTAGFAYGGVYNSFTGGSNTRTGWTAGGGVEWMFLPNWSAKGEYLFTDLDAGGVQNWWGQAGVRRHPEFHTVRAGVNYHFNWASSPTLGY